MAALSLTCAGPEFLPERHEIVFTASPYTIRISRYPMTTAIAM
jgi:hypothetical protein